MVSPIQNCALTCTHPFAKAVKARATTKLGINDDTSTTSDSAAMRSRNSHMIQTKNALAVGSKLINQYEMTENSTDIRTARSRSEEVSTHHTLVLTKKWQTHQEIRKQKRSRTAKPI